MSPARSKIFTKSADSPVANRTSNGMSPATDLTIVIPLYNEASLLKKVIPDFVQRQSAEVLIVENGSTDNSRALLKDLAKEHTNLRVLHLPYPSFGTAVRTGLLNAKHNRVVLLNADWLAADFIERAIKELSRADIVVGSKAMSDSHDRRPWFRKLTSHLLTRVVKLLYGYRGGDTHGLKAFNIKTVRPIIKHCRSAEIIESELLVRAQRGGLKIDEIPTTLSEIRSPRINVGRRMGRMARELLVLRRVLKSQAAYPMLHADDAGASRASVDALIDLAKAGRLAGISVLANASKLNYFASQFKKLPPESRPKLFLHFNVVEGPALTTDGPFLGKGQIFKQAFQKRLDESAIRQELAAQYQKLRDLDLPIVGIDSHQHMHALEPMAGVVADFARDRKLETRNLGDHRAETWRGKLKLALFKVAARLTNGRYKKQWRLPVTWRGRAPAGARHGGGQTFVVASWEKIRPAQTRAGLIICHPLLGHDKSLIQ